MKNFIAAVTIAFLSSSVYANCGNDKNVGNGCSTSVPTSTISVSSPVAVTTPVSVTTPVTVTTPVSVAAPVNTTTNIGLGVTNGNSNNLSSDSNAVSRSNASSVSSGGNSVANNVNRNEAQGGQGGYAVSQGGTGGNAVATNTATGGAGGSVNGNTVQSNSEINVSNTTVTNVPRPPVASAVAPNTIFSGGMDSCMGSSSGSVQGMSFGVAIGSTWTDNHCVALRAAVRLNELGFKNTAAARLCAIPEIAEAFRKSKEFDCGE